MALSDTSPAVVYYDIAFSQPYEKSTSAPNPWKARYALNMKGISYKTTWVPMLEISNIRQKVGAPACRKFADGTDYYTLPMLTDSTTNAVVGDSFDIALYLQKQYPNSGACADLFAAQKLDFKYALQTPLMVPLSERDEGEFGEYVRFNTNIDAAFTAHVLLMAGGMPFEQSQMEGIQAEFARRSGGASSKNFSFGEEDRVKMMVSFREAVADLATLLNQDQSGPFILGHRSSYADCIVGGWLRMMKVTLPSAEWEEVMGWYDGVFERLYLGLEQFAEVK
ncbi:hypothetical protein N7466_006573 [Penicillium verhagenii]|uniref:uncharacterized protein n=1 Tax=Penicillium verhagenii TaxID=1562060 RepID=UPI00254559C7|nr:uncharacterized protein N7466_006573 [Penicillium verhagenii]KAJ5931080.1 hypothetical protein N7466_006573 [Penicillium verhagenii]